MLETIIAYFLLNAPFGSVPFTASQLDSEHVVVEVLKDPPVRLTLDKNFNVVEIDGVNVECEDEL